jgi:two-component system sensor histidine kinase RpfC
MASILLMEDDLQQSFFWAGKLRLAGHEVTACRTGSEAFAAFERDPFNLLITDIFVRKEGEFLPDGAFSLIRRIRNAELTRAAPRRRRLPIIVLSAGYTGQQSKQLFSQLRDIGADICITKPVEPAAMIEAIDHLLARAPA